MARMKILNQSEQDIFESPPIFNSVERRKFFTPSGAVNELMNGLKTPTNKVCFLVTAGYFKARRRFFAKQFHQADVEFAMKIIGIDIDEVQLSTYDRTTYLRHKSLILSHFGFNPFDFVAQAFIKKEISMMVKVQFRPKIIFLEIIQVLAKKRISCPSYNALATLIVKAIHAHHNNLSQIIKSNLTEGQKEKLETLLETAAGTGSNSKWRYQITLLKKPHQSTRPSKIKANTADLRDLMALYLEIKPIVDRLALSYECLRYYAYSVVKSQVHQIFRRAEESRYLHLIAFIVCQTLKLQDMLIDTLLLAVQAVRNTTHKDHKEIYYQERDGRNQSITNLANDLQKDFLGTISTIKIIIADAHLTADQKIFAINAALNAPRSKDTKLEQTVNDFKSHLKNLQQGKNYYDILEERSLKLQNRVADIVRQTLFDKNCGKPFLLEAILHYQKKSGHIDKSAPIAFLSSEERTLMMDQNGKFRVSLYKALLYLAIFDAIKSGVLNIIHSEKYRSLEDYLIPKAEWQAHKDQYLQRANLAQYLNCQTALKSLDEALESRYQKTNSNFIAGENKFLSFRKNGTFHVSTPKLEEEEDTLSLGVLFPEQKYISVLEALATVDHATGFLEEFEHWQMKYQHKKPDKKIFFAGIMAYGCDIGQRKFAQISKNINENELDNTLNWCFSLANVQNANDRILQFMDQMDLPNIYRQEDDLLHTSSDGQKAEVSVDSLNANYSFKYLGKDKGVSIMSFIDMRQMMWHSTVISSAEREAAYVIDGLMRNDVIKSDIHSTDTHGFSEVIFAVTHLLGFTFAPRIKGLGHQKLYAFNSRKMTHQKTKGFQPHKYINEEAVHTQWDEILRFIVTIRLKVTTASQLFRRLNSYSKQHPLYKALKELGKIQKTQFILKYVDDLPFRQAIEKQLNKVEGSHKLSKAISIGNDHAFIQGDKENQDIAEGCRRLIKNTAICWNYLYVAKKIYEERDEERKKELIRMLLKGSVVRWGHFNFNGEYDFSDEKMLDSIGLVALKKWLSKTNSI